MILADLGADVIRVDRPGGQLLTGGAARPAQPRPAERRARPQAPGRASRRARPRRDAPTCWSRGCARASTERLGLGPDAVPGPQPAAGLRPDDRLGPGRPAGRSRRPRPQLHRDHRRAVRRWARTRTARTSRATWSATSAAGRRTSSSGSSPPCSSRGVSGEGQVVDAAIVDGTAHLNAMAAGFLAGGAGREERGRQPARRRRAVLRPLRDRRRPALSRRGARAAVLRRAGRRLLGIADTAPDRERPREHGRPCGP